MDSLGPPSKACSHHSERSTKMLRSTEKSSRKDRNWYLLRTYCCFNRGGRWEVKYLAKVTYLSIGMWIRIYLVPKPKQARWAQWLRQDPFVPRGHRSCRSTGAAGAWAKTALEVGGHGGPRRPPPPAERRQPGWQVVLGEKELQVASECLFFSDISLTGDVLSSRIGLLFSLGRSNCSEVRALSCRLSCAAWVLAPQTLPTHFSCWNKELDGGFLSSVGPRVRDSEPFGQSLLPRAHSASSLWDVLWLPTIRASWTYRPGLHQDHLSFGITESS